MKEGDTMKQLRTEGVAQLLRQPQETVRTLLRTKTVDWGVYIQPKKARFGRGQYVHFAEKFPQATGFSMQEVEAVMT